MVNLVPTREKSYQGLFTVLVMFYSNSIHPELNLLPLCADLDDPVPQLQLLSLCFADTLLQRQKGIKGNGL